MTGAGREEETDRVLAARAAALAAVRIDAAGAPAELHLVVRVGTTRFAIPAAAATRVLVPTTKARVPGAAPAIVGITAAEGHVVPVADAALLLEVDSAAAGPRPAVLVADGGAFLGLLVDEAEGLVAVDVATDRPAAEGTGAGRRLLVAASDGLLVLDVEALRQDQRLIPPHRTHIPAEPGAR